MNLTLSDLTSTTFTGGLGTLRAIVEAAQGHAAAESIAPSVLLEGRLSPDMFTFAQQVQAATDAARRLTDRLSGLEASSLPDPGPSFEGLTERINATIERVASGDAAKIDATADVEMTIDLGTGPMQLTGRTYALGFGLPNFLFHVTTAYNIMRMQGLPLGKIMYVVPFMAACNRS